MALIKLSLQLNFTDDAIFQEDRVEVTLNDRSAKRIFREAVDKMARAARHEKSKKPYPYTSHIS